MQLLRCLIKKRMQSLVVILCVDMSRSTLDTTIVEDSYTTRVDEKFGRAGTGICRKYVNIFLLLPLNGQYTALIFDFEL